MDGREESEAFGIVVKGKKWEGGVARGRGNWKLVWIEDWEVHG